MKYTIKRGDTDPAFATVFYSGTTPVDLSAATAVRIIVRLPGAASPKVNAAMTIVSPATSGAVTYQWQTADTDTAGRYEMEYEITWNTGRHRTIPTPGKDELVIESDLGGAA
jgi:hypothetical protein